MKVKEFDFRVWDISKKIYYKDLELSMTPSDKNAFGINLGIIFARNLKSASMLSDNCEIELYTGLRDKNNAKIYEGDILRFDSYTHIGLVGAVVFNKRFGCFACRIKDAVNGFNIIESFELIDNIHKDSNLLGW